MTQPRPQTRDFSKKRPPVYFTIDGTRYDCFKALDLDQLTQFAGLTKSFSEIAQDISDDDVTSPERIEETAGSTSAAIDKIAGLMKIVMKKASYSVFISKLRPSEEERNADDFEPVDYTQLLDIVKWLMEVYTGRPSKPSSTSSDGSESADGGTSSTAGASLEELEPIDLSQATS